MNETREDFPLSQITPELIAKLSALQSEGVVDGVFFVGIVAVKLPVENRKACRQIVGDVLRSTKCLESTSNE